MLDGLVDPDPFPAWSTPEDLAVYVEAFDEGGWTGPLNRYRAQGVDAEQLGSQTEPGPVIRQPAAFIGGELDPIRRFVPGADLFADAGRQLCRLPRRHDRARCRPLGAAGGSRGHNAACRSSSTRCSRRRRSAQLEAEPDRVVGVERERVRAGAVGPATDLGPHARMATDDRAVAEYTCR